MTVKECYDAMGGNYDEVLSRLRDDTRIAKFLGKILADPSYELLVTSIANNNAEDAFRAAHTIKGICLNLAVTKLYGSSNALTEALRGKSEITDEAHKLREAVTNDYNATIASIKRLQA